MLAILVANLPVRWWGPFEERLPLYQYAWVAALVTLLAGFAIGIPGYLEFLRIAAHGFNQAVMADPNLAAASKGWAVASLAIYLFTTPQGLLATYMVTSGLARFASAFIVDEPRGDLILTALDAGVRKAWAGATRYDQRRARERLEGPATADRVVRGAQVGRPDIELVVLASRRKSEWAAGSYLVGADGTAFRLGAPFDYGQQGALRTAYPLTSHQAGEVIRHAIPYQIRPLTRSAERPSDPPMPRGGQG